jgi:hypothetical protein
MYAELEKMEGKLVVAHFKLLPGISTTRHTENNENLS